MQFSVEAANVRHEHEYHVWEDVEAAGGQDADAGRDLATRRTWWSIPKSIAERIVNYAERVGKENVQTGTDCGIGSRVGHEEIVWAKFRAMSDGAALASKRLWSK